MNTFRLICINTFLFVDFDDFGAIREQFEGALEWYQNHQNPKSIDMKNVMNVKFIILNNAYV